MTISQHTVQGEQSRDYASGTVDFTEGEGFEELSEWCDSAYPEYYRDDYQGYRGNHSTAAAINSLIEGLEPSEDVRPFASVETEPTDNVPLSRLSIALSPDALDSLQQSLEDSDYPNSVRFGSSLQKHLKRVIQHFARQYTDFSPSVDE